MNGEMSYKQSKYSNLIDRFANSGHKICEITFAKGDKCGKEDKVILQCINQAARRFSKPHIHAVRRDSKMYLINAILCK